MPMEERTCRICGCTEDRACIGPDGLPCYWVEKDLCSACVIKDRIVKEGGVVIDVF